MSARDAVLAKVAAALGREASSVTTTLADQPPEVTKRLQAAHRHTLPRVADDLLEALTHAMESVAMSVVRLQSMSDVVKAVEWYLESENLDAGARGDVTVAPALEALEWPDHYASGKATGVEKVSITPCLAAVAETGSVVTASNHATPATLNFLPETHIIVLRESQVKRHVDDVFPLLRDLDILPRAVNFISGPSRTGDIEQTIEIGAHGPRRMHVLLLAGE